MIKIKVIDPQKPDQVEEVDLRPETMLNQECLIGRFANCDLVLDSVEVSRRHCKVSKKNGTYYFADLASRCGSRINGENAQINKDYPLQPDATIQIGRFILVILHIGTEENKTIQLHESETLIENKEEPLSPPFKSPEIPQKIAPPVSPEVVLIDPSQLQRWVKGELTVDCIDVIDETHDVKTFRFVANPLVLFTYKPGQFVTLSLEINGEEVSRSYSISSTPSRPHTLEITVKRVPPPPDSGTETPGGLVSNWLHENVTAGSKIKLNPPYRKFTCFANPSQKLLLISAGSGITPMMSMSRWLCDTGSHCDVIFFHCARSPRDIIFRQELELMSARHPNFHLAVSTTRKEPGHSWLSLTGRLDATMLQVIAPDFCDRTVYVCGPDAFMGSVNQMMESLNFPAENYYEESFEPPRKKRESAVSNQKAASSKANSHTPSVQPSLKDMFRNFSGTVAESNGDSSKPVATPTSPLPKSTFSSQPAVLFSKSGKEVVCDGEEPILNLAEQEGVKIRSGCRIGNCGSCKKRKLEGEVRMEGESDVLDESELREGYILTCISHPIGRVVIDA